MMKRYLLLLLVCIGSLALLSHEYVLIAADYTVKKGETLLLHLFVADGFNVEAERPVQLGITRSFGLISETGSTDLLGEVAEGDLPILERVVDFDGPGLLHMERDFARITLSNEDFKDYLKVDHIENITIDDSTRTEQSERYSRYIKCLVQSGEKTTPALHNKKLGHQFEIVLLEDPYSLHAGDWIRAQVFFMGQPLTGKVITARSRQGGHAPVYQYNRTDTQGICSFKLEQEGDWFFHATHMIPSRDPSDTIWESFWTTYSFGLGGDGAH